MNARSSELGASGVRASLPAHDELSRNVRIWETACLIVAGVLFVVLVVRVAPLVYARPLLVTWAVLGALVADFASGLVHWTADTWGSESLPFLGRRFVRPFRVHHVNPDDFLRRDFIDCNGDVAMLAIPLLLIGLAIPIESAAGRAAVVFFTAFAAVGLPTNQVHQWAHRRRPPRFVAWLQRRGLILSRADHARHHRPPHVANYCIATGWCNRPLAALRFFERLERVVTWCTGLRPRADDLEYSASCRVAAGTDALSTRAPTGGTR